MIYYFGLPLLQDLMAYYSKRLAAAVEKGFNQDAAPYRWLYTELNERVCILRKTILFLDALPRFIEGPDGLEHGLSHVISYITTWFSDAYFGSEPGTDSSSFYCDDNPYWADFNEIHDGIGTDNTANSTPQVYLDLCEYTVRALRLHFQIRERRISAIDRDRFDALMGRPVAIPEAV